MRLNQIDNKNQLLDLKQGDIIPMFDNWDCIDGHIQSIVQERDGETVLFLGRYELGGGYVEILVDNIDNARVEEGKYPVALNPINPEPGILFSSDTYYPELNKFKDQLSK